MSYKYVCAVKGSKLLLLDTVTALTTCSTYIVMHAHRSDHPLCEWNESTSLSNMHAVNYKPELESVATQSVKMLFTAVTRKYERVSLAVGKIELLNIGSLNLNSYKLHCTSRKSFVLHQTSVSQFANIILSLFFPYRYTYMYLHGYDSNMFKALSNPWLNFDFSTTVSSFKCVQKIMFQ